MMHTLIPLHLSISRLILICLIVICTWEVLHARRAHPGYNQVTLERSDLRTDFRTRLKNKQLSVDGGAKLILPCRGKQAWYIPLSSAI